ncbi:hypothetical protein ACO34A_12540 [Rhizobium sp. ACO-34A]|nr:hypothetical protein ACO34A_12540 [Rhizobium sp. ACO-34A]
MREIQSMIANPLAKSVGELHREFGFWRVARALLSAVWQERRISNRVDGLNSHMRRDIGLPEVELPRRPISLNPWDARF